MLIPNFCFFVISNKKQKLGISISLILICNNDIILYTIYIIMYVCQFGAVVACLPLDQPDVGSNPNLYHKSL